MKHARLPCGCQHTVGDREQWTERCEQHAAEDRETHNRWQAERVETMREFDSQPKRQQARP